MSISCMKLTLIVMHILLLIFFSCKKDGICNAKIIETLIFADTNRVELEKVLDYYQNDSLKLLAAKYLIGNMKDKYSIKSMWVDSLLNLKKKLYEGKKLNEEEIEYARAPDSSYIELIYDAKVITSEYLIKSIEFAFWNWQNRIWNKSLSFEIFCSFLLPYRINNEPLSDWQLLYKNKYLPIIDSLYKGDDMILAAKTICDTIRSIERWDNHFSLPHHDATFLLNYPIGECKDLCDHVFYILRSVGIPVSVDMYPYSPERRFAHHWNVIKEPNGKITSFWISETDIIKHKHDNRKKGKVYRLTYECEQNEFTQNRNSDEILPFFKDDHLKDVTEEYFGYNNIKLRLSELSKAKYAYLCVFSFWGWQPIAIAEIRGHEVLFSDLQPGLIYFPFVYEKKKLTSFSYPFLFNGNISHFFDYDSSCTKNVRLTRKYPFNFERHQSFMDNVVGVSISGMNDLNISDSDILFNISDTPKLAFNYLSLLPLKKYKYVMYKSPKDKNIILAEFSFYSDKKKLSPNVYFLNDTDTMDVNNLKNISDNDPLTYLDTNKIGIEVIFEFDKPYKIDKIEYTLRNDDNYIRIGDEYELFVYNSKKGWMSIDKKTSCKEYIQFSNVPIEGIYLLHNSTRGNEEQVFYIKNGIQFFP